MASKTSKEVGDLCIRGDAKIQILHCTSVTVDHGGLLISDDTKVLIESAKTAASASNSTVSYITERLRNISQEVERMTLTNVSVNIDDMLIDADQACEYLMVENSSLLNILHFFIRLHFFLFSDFLNLLSVIL